MTDYNKKFQKTSYICATVSQGRPLGSVKVRLKSLIETFAN